MHNPSLPRPRGPRASRLVKLSRYRHPRLGFMPAFMIEADHPINEAELDAVKKAWSRIHSEPLAPWQIAFARRALESRR